MGRNETIRVAEGARILFLDMGSVQAQHNVVQRVVAATKHAANPVLPLGDMHEWDSLRAAPWAARTVIYDDEERLFKCWYLGTDISQERWRATGYAVSEDGIHWMKPRLGLYDYNGSTQNNICFPDCGPVIKDSAEPDPEKRYKMIARGNKAPSPFRPTGQSPDQLYIYAAYSGDGIQWREGPRIDLSPPGEGVRQSLSPDVAALVKDDQDPDPQRRYKLVWQVRVVANKPGPERVRAKSLGYGADVEHFTSSPANPILTPNDGPEQENHFLMLAPYHGYYVMLYECGWYVPNGQGKIGTYSADIRLAVGRDGEHFTRIQAHQQVIPRGRHGEWDDGFLVISDKPVIKDDTIYLYYAGHGEEWTSWPNGNSPHGFRSGYARLDRMGLATLPRDRFTCLETTDREIPGSVTIGPIEVAAGDLTLVANVSDTQQNRSWLEVEVLDADGKEPLPGFDREACVPVCRDGLRVPVQWKERRLADLDPGRVKLRCWLYGAARLYALGFEQ